MQSKTRRLGKGRGKAQRAAEEGDDASELRYLELARAVCDDHDHELLYDAAVALHNGGEVRRALGLYERAARDAQERGEAPLLWLDAACMAPDDWGLLELLPHFTVGCQRFVMLAGPTYAGRLWCVAELFCFLKGGGDVDGDEASATVLSTLATLRGHAGAAY